MLNATITVILLVMSFSFVLAANEEDKVMQARFLYMSLITQFTAVILVLVEMILNR